MRMFVRKPYGVNALRFFFTASRGRTFISRQYKGKNILLLRRSSIILGIETNSGFCHESL